MIIKLVSVFYSVLTIVFNSFTGDEFNAAKAKSSLKNEAGDKRIISFSLFTMIMGQSLIARVYPC